jgi:uncharacterized membrane protein YccC
VGVTAWVARHDPGYVALRRAGRVAIVMPLLFAFGSTVVRNSDVALFSAFGAFAMLLFVDFGGPMRERVQAQLGLAAAGAVFVCLGTLVSRPAWLGALAMAIVAFVVLFAGSVSSVLASASTSLLLAFILPVSIPAPLDAIGPRLLGWAIASAVALLAIVVLWPAPVREPLRGPAEAACRALARRLRAESAFLRDRADPAIAAERASASMDADAAVAALRRAFLASPYRPTGLSTPARTIVRLVDEITWLDTIVRQAAPPAAAPAGDRPSTRSAARAVKDAAAAVLDEGAAVLATTGADTAPLHAAIDRLAAARLTVEQAVMTEPASASGADPSRAVGEFITALDPGFRAQELAHATAQVGRNIALTAAAERRTLWQRLAGRQPGDLPGPIAAAAERATGYLGWNSVWLRNSIRGAIGLGLAVLLADLTGVQHSFWVVLGTLSVLRSSAMNTGQTALRGVVGTAVGVMAGAALLFLIGGNVVVLWILLPIAILAAGVAPAAVSFAAGQAGFTVVLVLLFNIIAPTGWTVGLLRIEDVAIGCAVSLVVGLLLWPRGAAAALRRSLADAYTQSARYLSASVAFGLGRCDASEPFGPEPTAESLQAAAASRRLDDTFRTYLAERGAKRRPLADVSAWVTGIAGLRLASDAIVEIWRAQAPVEGDRAAARRALDESADSLDTWYRSLADRLVAAEEPPAPAPADPSLDGRLADAVTQDLSDESGSATATAVRIIWTGDYLDAVRRLEANIVAPAQVLGAAASGGGALSVPRTP